MFHFLSLSLTFSLTFSHFLSPSLAFSRFLRPETFPDKSNTVVDLFGIKLTVTQLHNVLLRVCGKLSMACLARTTFKSSGVCVRPRGCKFARDGFLQPLRYVEFPTNGDVEGYKL